jgi:hypothetical protein
MLSLTLAVDGDIATAGITSHTAAALCDIFACALQPVLTDAEARRLRGRAEVLAVRHPLYPALG